ncbi:hypothetical protein Poli38472_002152 [Pythium oligandrum]|uniref:Bromo domain-containing protein n=1 Tax=Pythium oligandrum TaxID=41045 RepID=A0A8K1FHY3_PYTOL|nr:hypothetical protein Poli38472_002152 [Pythium oligandrum]|eukprot:TMW63211.1 hypothetical protein Poli38472_002152 [Pythium oligandrum]
MASPTPSHSDDDEAHPTHHEQLYAMVELAQVCDFCTTFQTPLKLPPFSRTNLQAALIAGTQGDDYQVTLLAEVHYKLAREQTNVKIERMLQDWEKAVTRKVTDNWRLEFSSNPFDGATYADLSVAQRIQILNALCHWKLDSCADIHKHLAAIQKEGDAKAIETLRATPIGYDDAGAAYWYFDDECWVYAEDRPTWQADQDSDRLRSYAVEYADGKRIRLSVNFEPMDPTQVLTKVAKSLELKANGTADEGNMDIKAVMVETSESPIEEIDDKYPVDAKNCPLKAEVETKAEVKKMDINMLCGSPAESDGDTIKSVEDLSIQEDVELKEEVKAEQPEASMTVDDSVATDLPNGTSKVKEEPNTSNDISNPHKKRQLVDDDKSEEEVEVTNGPSGWRVVCSSVESLRQLTLKLVDGSLEQERLRGRLISILKVQEKLEEERLKKQETMWQILPRRQSSRIAIGRIKTQTTSGEDESEDEDETHSRSRRSARSASSNGGTGYDSHQRLALERESRARRRQKIQYSDDESDEDMEGAPPSVKGWVNWSQLPSGNGRVVIVCRALVDRLLKEEIAELFARPVDPEEDGCPDYLTIIEHPIDLGTIRQRLDTGFYESWDLFALDVERVWSNCRRYNAPDMVVVQYANELEKMFRTMQKEAERKGMRRVKPQRDPTDDMDDDDDDDEDMDKSSDKESDANKAWSNSESSASDESSDDSEDDASGSDDEGRNKRRSAKPAPSSRTRPARSTRQASSASSSSRTDRNRNRTRRRNAHSDSESSEESAQSESEEESEDGARKPKRPARSRAAALRAQAQPVVPPPPVQTESKKPVRRNRIDSSDSSSSENESSSDESEAEADFSASINSSKNEDAPAPPPSSPPPPPPPPPSTDETAKPAGSSSTPRKPLLSKRSAPLSPSRSPLSSSSSYFSSSSDSDSSDHSSDSD